jgi:AcrR family transcriptional regulator
MHKHATCMFMVSSARKGPSNLTSDLIGQGQERVRAEQQRSLETRAMLVTAARRLFGDVGYHAAGTGEIVARAQVTRGALYHHFRNKEDLFEAVCRQVEGEISQKAQAATRAMEGQTRQRALASLRIYLELLATSRDVQRILLVDGPAVLGWERWRAIRSDFEFAGWVRTLSLLRDKGQIEPAPIEALAQIILAAIDEAVLAVAHAADPATVLTSMTAALTMLIGGLTLRGNGEDG